MAENLYCISQNCHVRAAFTLAQGKDVIGICSMHRQTFLYFFPTARERIQLLPSVFEIPSGWEKIVQKKFVTASDKVSEPTTPGARYPVVVGRRQL